ncbi:class I adenylate-forming enzyme family protein [Paraburkholderia fungorum]|uniref:class I adenylate-forming enzyme family protein n=1 Tax=Paraburkholderia fungorum TaxID=134537 RepID=UPI0038B830D6
MRLETLLRARAQRVPDKTCIRVGARRLTYRQFVTDCHALASGMHHWGVKPGQRVLIYLPNSIEFAQALYAAFMLGATVVPVNTRLTLQELSYFLEDSVPAVAVVPSGNVEAIALLRARFPQVRLLLAGNSEAPGLEGAKTVAELAQSTDESLPEVPLTCDDCMILYTSGTTGRPKGAVITHANCVVQHGFLNAMEWGISDSDTFLVTTPLAHRTGLARLLNAFNLGATLVVMERFDAEEAVSVIEREAVTALGMVPTVARMLLPVLKAAPARCASLRHVIVTGEAFPVELKRQMIDLLPAVQLHSFFAMTEVGSITSLTHDEQFSHPASVGRPTVGVEVKLVDERDNVVPVETVGEILVRSGEPGRFTTMRGYYNRPDETAAAITDGWVRTGDLAKFDVDGYLYIVDRKKDMVLSGGFNVYTKEVELALIEHPAVADAAVIGVPDEIYGEAVAAFVELRAGTAVTEATLIEHTKERIAGYKKPRHVFFIDTLPRSSLGKVLKAQLRELARERLDEATSNQACAVLRHGVL